MPENVSCCLGDVTQRRIHNSSHSFPQYMNIKFKSLLNLAAHCVWENQSPSPQHDRSNLFLTCKPKYTLEGILDLATSSADLPTSFRQSHSGHHETPPKAAQIINSNKTNLNYHIFKRVKLNICQQSDFTPFQAA